MTPKKTDIVDVIANEAPPRTVDLTQADMKIAGFADRTLAEGVQIERWFEEKAKTDSYAERFDIIREYNSDGRSFGFFDTAPIGERQVPVMGLVQEMFYDRQKAATGRDIQAQLREFILHYFMRVSHFRRPEPMTGEQSTTPSYLRPFAWNPNEAEDRVGFGFQQLYFKRRGGEVGKFAPEDRFTIVDLRTLGQTYEWLVLKVHIFDFNLVFAPFGSGTPKMVMPMNEQTYLVIGPQFVRNQENCPPGVLAEYGYGYAFMPCVPEGAPEFIAYGPGHFAGAFQSVHFTLMESGDIRVRAPFIVNRPVKVAKVDIDPIGWGFKLADMLTFNLASKVLSPVKQATTKLPLRISDVDPISTYIALANFVSGGRAASELGHSMGVLERRMLVQHYMQHYEMLITSLLVWRKVVDWTDPNSVPEYCRLGVEC